MKVVPALRSRNISIVCAMTRKGIVHYQHRNSAINKVFFIEFLSDLKTKIADLGIGRCILIMDNVPFHRSIDVRNAIEEGGHTIMLLQPYSPFFNPIENLFSKWKSLVKRSQPSNEDHLMTSISNGSSLITRHDCEGFVRHMWSNIRRCANGEEDFE